MAEECPNTEVPRIEMDETPMECETSDPQSVKAGGGSSDEGALKISVSVASSTAAPTPISDTDCPMNTEDTRTKPGALTLPVSGASSAAASTSVSDSECAKSPEKSNVKAESLTVPASGVASAAASTPISDSECAMSSEEAHGRGEALTLPVSGATSAAVSDSGCAMSPDDMHSKADADPSDPPEPTAVAAPVTAASTGNQEILSAEKVAEIMSPEKEKGGIFKGVKTAIKTKVKSVWKKLSPKKPEKAALAAAAQEAESKETSETEKKPIKVVTYVSATRGSLVCNSVASDEMTLDTDLPTSNSEVFLADEGSVATCDTATHASRLPSLGESSSAPSDQSPEHDNAQESSGNRDEAMEDENVGESS